MAMEHRAFLFDFAAFNSELRPVLEAALSSNDSSRLIQFIEQHLGDLKDPYEGEPLGDDWQSMIEQPDPHQFGDFALTKYYDPTEDIGLGPQWEQAQEIITNHVGTPESPVLGTPIGPSHSPFDPGKMGSYFQSEDQVKRNLEILVAIDSESEAVEEAIDLLAQVQDEDKGLYITF